MLGTPDREAVGPSVRIILSEMANIDGTMDQNLYDMFTTVKDFPKDPTPLRALLRRTRTSRTTRSSVVFYTRWFIRKTSWASWNLEKLQTKNYFDGSRYICSVPAYKCYIRFLKPSSILQRSGTTLYTLLSHILYWLLLLIIYSSIVFSDPMVWTPSHRY